MATVFPEQEALKKALPELNALPDGWLIGIGNNKRITFQKGTNGNPIYIHPTLGPLPKPWILRLCGGKVPKYFNPETSMATTMNPRHNKRIMREEEEARKRQGLGESCSVVRVSKSIPWSEYRREPIQDKDIRDNYEIVKVLDNPLAKNKLGQFNGGVFVVRHKRTEMLSVEKRFKQKDFELTTNELYLVHRLKHSSIALFTAGFVTSDGLKSSLYVEFCDRGSMENLINAFAQRRLHAKSDAEWPEMPERFIWHAFAGLCDGLAYLQGGRSYASNDVTEYVPSPGWVPILHRDMKPDNVLIRSRGTVGTKRYFYCVLSDFGLACEDWPSGHPLENDAQSRGSKLGTKTYWAPELLYDPYPRGGDRIEERRYPYGYKHTAKSDLWALGSIIYNLADCGPTQWYDRPVTSAVAHIPWAAKPPDVDDEHFQEGTLARKKLDISTLTLKKAYSDELKLAILQATRPVHKRPDPILMMGTLKTLMQESGFTNHIPKGHEHEQLPNWATRVHDYHSLPAIDPTAFPEN